MSELDPRPTMARREELPAPEAPVFHMLSDDLLRSLEKGDAVIKMLHMNPTFSFADVAQRYDEWKAAQPAPVVEKQPEPIAPAPQPQPVVEPAAVVHTPLNPPPGPHVGDRVQPTPEPAAMQPEPAPVLAPVQTAAVDPTLTAAQSLVDDAKKQNQPTVAATAVRRTDFGSQPHREEISELPADDPHQILIRTDELIGSTMPMAGSEKVRAFFAGIKRNSKGQPMFASEAEAERYQTLVTALELTPPTAGNGRPAFDVALEREDTPWTQLIKLPDGKHVGPVTDRGVGAQGALAALRRRRQSGSPVSVWLPATGIYVGFRAPLEREMCDFDIRLAAETAQIGMQTYGLLLSSMSGVYLRHMIEHSLNFAIETTYDCQGNDIKTALIDIVDIDDYWLLLLGPIMAKFPTGIPWKLVCPNDCGHEREVKLNLARCIRMADGLFTDLHRSMLARQRGTTNRIVGPEDYQAYRNELPHNPASTFARPDLGITVTFGRTTIGNYLDSTDRWLEEINRSATEALSSNASDYERSQHIRLTAEIRRLTRHAHLIKSITVEEEVKGDVVEVVETDPAKIIEILEELSSDRPYVLAFEEALAKYNDLSRLAVLGYMGHPCPSCQATEGEEEGPFRGIVTISPDRIFFVLSRVVSEIQKVYLQQFANIG